MADFWRSAGWQLVTSTDEGRIQVSDDWLRAYLLRPELALVAESCPGEHALHARLMEQPRAEIDEAALTALVDADVRANYQVYSIYRDRLLAHASIEAAYLDVIENGISGIPSLFLDQLVHVLMRHLLQHYDDPFRLRAAELFFRTQKVTIQDGRVMLADEETVDMHASGQSYGSLGKLLVETETKLASVDLDVLDESNAETYWQRSDRFDTVLDLLSLIHI